MKLYYTTFPNDEERERIANILVDEGLAGCIVSTSVDSLYMWDGEKQEDDEVAVLFKTTEAQADEFLVRLDDEHPYDVPCILEIPAASNKSYDLWLHETTDSIVDTSSTDNTALVRFDIGPLFRVDTNMTLAETVENVQGANVSGELADLLNDIARIDEEYGQDADVQPILVNGNPATLSENLSAFTDDEPVHIALR